MIRHETVIIEQFEYFERASLRNRCYVAGPQGRLCLSIPLEGGRNQQQIMKDIRVSYNEAWQKQHWRTIEACYRRSPFFEYFEPELFTFFHTHFNFLIDANLESVRLINRCLNIKKEIILSAYYMQSTAPGMQDLRKRYSAKEHQPAIPVKYVQPFEERHGFVPGLSILDFLCCAGRQGLTSWVTIEK